MKKLLPLLFCLETLALAEPERDLTSMREAYFQAGEARENLAKEEGEKAEGLMGIVDSQASSKFYTVAASNAMAAGTWYMKSSDNYLLAYNHYRKAVDPRVREIDLLDNIKSTSENSIEQLQKAIGCFEHIYLNLRYYESSPIKIEAAEKKAIASELLLKRLRDFSR